MITFKSTRTKAFVLLGIIAATGSATANTISIINQLKYDLANTGCRSAGIGQPCNTFLDPNYGITTTVEYMCNYDMSGNYVGVTTSQACSTGLNSGCCNFVSPATCPASHCPGSV